MCFFYSCKKTGIEKTTIIYNGDTLRLETLYNKQGNISSEWTYKDSVKHGYVKLFYPNGKLESYTEYKQGKRDGVVETYNPDGTAYCKGFNKQDKRDSVRFWFYKDGTINNKNNFYDDHNWRDQYEYYPDHTLKEYTFYSDTSITYKRTYNKDGQFVNEEGKNLYILYAGDTIKLGGNFVFIYFAALLPEFDYSLQIRMKNQTGKIEYDTIISNKGLDDYPDSKKYIDEFKPSSTGKFTYTAILSRNDTINHIKKKDTWILNLVVVK